MKAFGRFLVGRAEEFNMDLPGRWFVVANNEVIANYSNGTLAEILAETSHKNELKRIDKEFEELILKE